MRRHDRPDSSHVDDERDITQQFWGAAPGWTDQPDRPRPPSTPRARRRDDTTGAIAAIRDGFAAFRPQLRSPASNDMTGEIDRTRSHGIVRPQIEAKFDDRVEGPTSWDDIDDGASYSYADAANDHIDLDDDAAFWGAAETGRMPAVRRDRGSRDKRRPVPLAASARQGDRLSLAAVDPLLLRVGIFILALVVLFPVAWAMRSDDAGTVTTGTAAENPTASVETTVIAAPTPQATLAPTPQQAPAAGQDTPAAAPAPAADQSSANPGSSGSQAGSESSGSSSSAGSSESTSNSSGSQTNAVEPPPEETGPSVVASGIDDEPATVDEPADRLEPDCSQTYLAQPGDSWFSIAEAAGITPTELVSSNQATLDTVILPGDEICLPAEATVPPQTTTTTAAPTTTTTTTEPEPEDSSEIPETSPEEVQQLIRDIWPDDLEEKALEIAFRESRYQHDAYNGWCCYGVFQIYWSVHQSWLDDYEIYRAEDLFHARKNIEAAYALYRAAGGWSPWSQTAY